MPATPSPSTNIGAVVRSDLAEFFEFDLMKNMKGFVGYQVLPIFNVAKRSDQFGRIPTEQLGKIPDVTRTSSGGYNRIHMTFTKDTYATDEYGIEVPVDRRNTRIYQELIRAEVATAMLALHTVLAAAEKRVADAVFNTTTFTGQTTTITNEWDDATNAVPITDVKAASQLVRNRTGQYANALIVNRQVFRNLQECDQILARIHASGAGGNMSRDRIRPDDVTPELIAQVMDLERVIVADSSYDSAAEGQATTFSNIWSNEFAMVARIANTDMIEEVAIGRTFHWTGDGSEAGGLVETYNDETVRGDVMRVRHDVHEKLIYTEAGQLLENITT